MYRSLLLALSLLLLALASKAAVFVVTSNADSGPGTLREALTLAAANGSAEKDYINFNLPDISEAGRTITLENFLPKVSSNLQIDGGTQPGTKFSISDAKVRLTYNIYKLRSPEILAPALTLVNVNDIQLYGLFISDFSNIQSIYLGAAVSSIGILLDGCQNVDIGEPGNGNMISGSDYHMAASFSSGKRNKNIRVRSNAIGSPDFYNEKGQREWYMDGDDIIIGGDNLNEGNAILSAGLQIGGTNIKIKNNSFGISPTGNNNSMGLSVNGANNVEISYNTCGTININLLQTINFKIFANKDALTLPGSSIGSIGMRQCQDGVIGSDDETLKNVFYSNTGNTVDLISSTIGNSSSKNIQILKNEIICSRSAYSIYLEANDNIVIPDIHVKVNNVNEYSGSATPGSTIYIYYDDSDCPVCSPLKFLTNTVADADGQWKITGNFLNKRLVSNALHLKNSSEFTQPHFSDPFGSYNVQQPNCGQNNGSIQITEQMAKHILRFEWYNSNNQKIGEGAKIKDLAPGTYYAKGYNGDCFARTTDIYLYDTRPIFFDNNKTITQPSCGKGGAITGLSVANTSNNPTTIKWVDNDGNKVGDYADVDNLKQGKFTLIVTDDVTGCQVKYGPVILKNTTGPTIDDSKPNIINTNCGQTIGAIKNIIVTGGSGTRHFTWKNEQQQEVAYMQDLTSQPAGKYTLQVTDDTQCGPVYSKEIEITEVNGITVVESTTPTTPASCGKANGAVTGLAATGGTKYEWQDVNGKLVGSSVDLTNVPGGAYQLTVSNAFCQKQSKVYQVLEQSGTVFPSTYTVNHIDACYGSADGALQINKDALIKSVRWVNSAGVDVSGIDNGVTNLPAGNYKLYLTDQNGCESYYNAYQVGQLPEYTVAYRGQTNDETCGLKNGYVHNATITGGLPPYTYTWLNANGEQIGSTNSVSNLAAGTYTLNVIDSRCGNVYIFYTIQNITQDLPAPSVSDLQVCSPGDALFFVNNPASNGVYRLYDQLNSTSQLAEQAGGSLKIAVTGNRSFFVSQVNGTCESPRSEVKVSVGLSTINITNAFSPNADGQNDYWKIDGIESYPQAVVQIFNRNGQKLFESRGYGTPFNGTYKGKPLPAGTYFYIINLNKNCNLLSGSLTIIR